MKFNYPFFIGIALLSIFSGSCASVAPKTPGVTEGAISLPALTGSFSIGLKKYHFKDLNRKDPYLDENLARELMVSLYYPADKSSNSAEVPYLESRMLKYYRDEMVPKSDLNTEVLGHIPTRVLREPPFSKAKQSYPVIILSPGSGVVPEFYLSIIRELVSHGFVVAAINHTYNALISVFPDNSVKLRSPIGNQLFEKIRTAGEDAEGALIKVNSDDIFQTLKALRQIDQSGHLDFSKIGMFGHSLGGMAITHACLNSPMCRAGVNLDGPLLGARSSVLHEGDLNGDLKKPFLFVSGKMIANISPKKKDANYKDKDVLDAISKLDPTLSLEEYYQFTKDRTQGRILKAIKKMGKNSSLLAFKNAEHMSFSDWSLINSSKLKNQEKLELLRFMKQLNSILINFFERHLGTKKIHLLNGVENPLDIHTNFLD